MTLSIYHPRAFASLSSIVTRHRKRGRPVSFAGGRTARSPRSRAWTPPSSSCLEPLAYDLQLTTPRCSATEPACILTNPEPDTGSMYRLAPRHAEH